MKSVEQPSKKVNEKLEYNTGNRVELRRAKATGTRRKKMSETIEMTVEEKVSSNQRGDEDAPPTRYSAEGAECRATSPFKLERVSDLAQMKRSVGMTLVEIMIVITIIAMVSGAVGYFVFGALDTANEGVAENEIIRLTEMVNTYYVRNGQLPSDLSDLVDGNTNLLEEVPEDPWGNEYVYDVHDGRDFTIYSPGPDGTPGTDVDVYADD